MGRGGGGKARWHTVLDGPHQESAGTEGVVDDQGHALLFADLGDGLEVGDVIARVPDALDVDGLGPVVDGGRDVLGLVAVDELGLDAEAREHHFELVVGSAVEVRGRDDIVAGVGQRRDGHELRALARGAGHSGDTPFQGGDPLLEDIDRRLHRHCTVRTHARLPVRPPRVQLTFMMRL